VSLMATFKDTPAYALSQPVPWRLLACSCKGVAQLEQPIEHQLRPHPPR
jgi:hypothetical protein